LYPKHNTKYFPGACGYVIKNCALLYVKVFTEYVILKMAAFCNPALEPCTAFVLNTVEMFAMFLSHREEELSVAQQAKSG
jgi:hypothetical protein